MDCDQGVDDWPPGDREHSPAQGVGGGTDSDAEGGRQQTRWGSEITFSSSLLSNLFALNNDFTEQILQQKKNPTKKSGGVTVVEGILGVSPVLWCRSVIVVDD